MRTVRILLVLFIAITMIPADPALAASDKSASDKTDEAKPVREVHNVVVDKKAYCFFVDHYVVLTPVDVAGKTDSELTGEILKRAGLYMK